jgi:membrane protease YdiL (CAAX protease family)
MNQYQYKPVRFYTIVFLLTWFLWFTAAFLSHINPDNGIGLALMLSGLLVPSVTALFMVFSSKSSALKYELKEKLFSHLRLKPLTIILSVIIFFFIISASIILSTFIGQSLGQFRVVDFSFSIGGVSTLFTLILTAFLEELGWRGYTEDSIATYFNWRKESLISGFLWSVWHLPLFFIIGTYQYNILKENPLYMINFFVSILPLDILFAWVYVKTTGVFLRVCSFIFCKLSTGKNCYNTNNKICRNY